MANRLISTAQGVVDRLWNLRRAPPERVPGATRYIWVPQFAGVRVTAESALQISAVFACMSVISKALASSVWDVFEQAADGARVPARDSKLFALLNISPNPEMTAFEFREALLIAALGWHGGYAEIERDPVGRPLNLWPLHPDRVRADRDAAGDLVYRVHNETSAESVIAGRDMFRIHGPGLDGLIGFEMSQIAQAAFAHSVATERFGAAFFGNGAQMGAVLESDQNITPEQKKELQEGLDAQHKGPAMAHKTLVLGGGLKWKQQAIEPEKAQFVETRQLLIEEVCRFFGVPPHKIAHLLRSTNNNIEHQGIEFVRDGLTPWAERLRQEADRKLRPVNKRGMRTRLDLEWLAEGDARTKAESDAMLVNAGIMNRNEVRRRRGLDGIPDGDKFTVPLNMTTLEKLGEDPPPAPPPPDDGNEDEEPAGPDEEAAARALRLVE
jgi:HK97 family phage portal protein